MKILLAVFSVFAVANLGQAMSIQPEIPLSGIPSNLQKGDKMHPDDAQLDLLQACIKERCPTQYSKCTAKKGCPEKIKQCAKSKGLELNQTAWGLCLGLLNTVAQNAAICGFEKKCVDDIFPKSSDQEFVNEAKELQFAYKMIAKIIKEIESD